MTAGSNETSENIVELSNLSRRFGQKLALDAIDLSIPRGCVLGLVGETALEKQR